MGEALNATCMPRALAARMAWATQAVSFCTLSLIHIFMEMISTGECDDRNYTYVMKPILYDGHSIRKIQKAK